MARLLVLSLAETTSHKESGYAVIARNLDENKWVIIPSLSKNLLIIDNKHQWDIFAITQVELKRRFDTRSDIYDVDIFNYMPYMLNKPITNNDERKKILDELSSDNIKDIVESSSWAGILKEPSIETMIFEKRKITNSNYDPKQTFFWECRLSFSDHAGYRWQYKKAAGVAVKDMRFKAYWRDLFLKRPDEYDDKKEKWLEYMRKNRTYLLVEFYPSDFLGVVAVVSGIISLNEK